MEPIKFSRDGYDYLITDYKVVGAKLKGMSDHKIFTDNGKFFKNNGDNLLEVHNFTISQNGAQVHNFVFDTNVRVGAAIVRNDEILLMYRKKDGREYYVYPGGHVKTQEDFLAAVIREVKEETGLDISSEPELILENNREGFGPEKFYLVKLDSNQVIFDENPEDSTGESKLVWYKISEALKLKDLFPSELIQKVNAIIS